MSKPTWKKKPLASAMPRAWALEPRLMFDAAAAATATEHVADASARAAAEAQTAARDSAPAHAAEAQPAARQEVVFVDSGITDYQALLRALPAGAEVVMLDADRNGFEQMAQYLQGRHGLDAIHLISEGERGAVRAGSTLLDLGATSAHAAELQRIGAALSDSGDLLLYGCNVGQGSEGAALLEQLATLTGADIAASTDWSGSAALGANWELEARVGSIESAVAIDALRAQAYGERLGVSPTITSATYNATSGVLTVTGSSMTAGDTIDVSKLTLTGEGGSTYTLTSANVTASSATAFSVTLNATDKAAFNQIANKAGTTSTSGTSFNLAAAAGWDASSASDADASNALTVSSVPVPAVTSATYDHHTGVLTVTGTGFLRLSGSNNDIDVSKLTLRGQGNATYTLTSANVEIIDGTTFTVQLNAADKAAAITLLNKNGTSSVGSTAYNLAAADDWAAGAAASVNVTDTTNPVTVSGVPTIASASYDINTGVLTVTGTGFVGLAGSNNDIDVSKLTLMGQGGVSYTLTSPNVEISSGTSFAVQLNAADKTAASTLFNKNGNLSAGNTAYNLAAAEDWAAGAPASMAVADLTSNAVTVSGVLTYTQLTFEAAQAVNIIGDGTHNGDVVRYSNVVTVNGKAVDAVITTSGLTGATVTAFDSPGTPANLPKNFQPLLQVTQAGGGVTFKVDFYEAGTYNSGTGSGVVVTLNNVVVNSYDIDAVGGADRQYQDFKGFNRYELASSAASTLSTTVLGDGSVRFQALTNVNNSWIYSDDYRVKVYYDSMSSFQFRTGVANAGATAHFSLQFDVGPDWSSPTVINDTPAPSLSYSPTSFTEAAANDGSVTTTSTITLSNGTFTGTDGQPLSGMSFANVPAGLTAVVTRVDATHATLSFTGSAIAHANANDLSNVTVSFGDAAFTSGNASTVVGATRSDLSIDFNDSAATPVTVTSPTVNEASPYAVFTVAGTAGQAVSLSLAGVSATGGGTDFGSSGATNLQVSTDGGTTWVNYTAAVTLPAGGAILVRTPVVEDTVSDNNETFTLTATPAGGQAATGTATIKDDGTGSVYKPDGSVDPSGPRTDDRPVSVTSPTVNEASPWAVFTVAGSAGQSVTLALRNGTAQGAGVDFGSSSSSGLQVSTDGGATWVNYPGGPVTLGNAALLVRVAIVDDATVEGNETFTLEATLVGGQTATSTALIVDNDALPPVLPPSDPSPSPSLPPAAAPAPLPPAPVQASTADNSSFATTLGVPSGDVVGDIRYRLVSVNPMDLERNDGNRGSNIDDIYTRSSGFRTMVTPAKEPLLRLFNGMTDQVIATRQIDIQLPADVFVHTDFNETVTLTARQANGQPLPSWLHFDGKAGTFTGEVPAGQKVDLRVIVTGRDTKSREANAVFRILSQPSADKPAGRVGLDKQLMRGEALTQRNGQWQAQRHALRRA